VDRRAWLFGCIAMAAALPTAQAQSRPVIAVLTGALADGMGDLVEILKGTPPGEIPFEQGTKFELAINLRAARALGLAIPHRVRVSADSVIE
jgi:ABC-type uncharacterized transport system substrate-binding protein